MYLAAVLVAVSVAALSYSPAHAQSTNRAGLAAFLMLTCCLIFALTDIFIKRALRHVDSYNFLVYYNALVAVAVLPVLPWLRRRRVPTAIRKLDFLAILLAAVFLIAATLLFVQSFTLAQGIILPNILVSTRGVFIVVLTAVAGLREHTALDVQSRWVFMLRLAASGLLVFSIWLALR
jgi:drug/metabolite transporter (DMT)-like permease